MNVQEIFELAGYRCYSYSGRGMYGRTCLGVTVNDLGDFFAEVLLALNDIVIESRNNQGDDESFHCDELELVSGAFRNMSTDQMGRGMVYYFPGIPYVGNEDEE